MLSQKFPYFYPLTWEKDFTGELFNLSLFDFNSLRDEVGIYAIFNENPLQQCVYVGQGNLHDRLSKHSIDQNILKFAFQGRLLFTFARVPQELLDRVERYLANYYRPLAGSRFPDVLPLPVDLPFVLSLAAQLEALKRPSPSNPKGPFGGGGGSGNLPAYLKPLGFLRGVGSSYLQPLGSSSK